MNDLYVRFESLLGLASDPKDLTFLQISLRTLIVFAVTLVMLRIADRRFLSKRSAFDAIVGFILASMLARAVNGSAAFFPTLGGGFLVVGSHRLLAYFTRNNHSLGVLLKGDADVLIEKGSVETDVMKGYNLSEHDIMEDIRINGNLDSIASVKKAYYERNGQVSVIKDH